MLNYNNLKSRLSEVGIKVINSVDDFQKTEMFGLEWPKGHHTQQKNISIINRLSAFSKGKCPSICGTCCNEDGILQKILPFMKEKGFELIELKDDHINLLYRCICGNVATSNTKNIKKTKSCMKCQNHLKYYLKMCEKALETDFEVVMTFKDYLENHDKIRYVHKLCGREFLVDFVKPMEFVCKDCQGVTKDEIKTPKKEEQDLKVEYQYGYKCIEDGCPYYAIYLGKDRPLYCDAHYPDDGNKSIFVGYRKDKRRTCIAPKCAVQATFNYEDGMRQIFCKEHKQPKMINVNSIKCID